MNHSQSHSKDRDRGMHSLNESSIMMGMGVDDSRVSQVNNNSRDDDLNIILK